MIVFWILLGLVLMSYASQDLNDVKNQTTFYIGIGFVFLGAVCVSIEEVIEGGVKKGNKELVEAIRTHGKESVNAIREQTEKINKFNR